MKSLFARLNLSPTRLEMFVMIALGAILTGGLVGIGSSIFTDSNGGNADKTMSTASKGGIAGSAGGGSGSGGGESGSGVGGSGSGVGGSGSGGGEAGSGVGGTGSGGGESGSGVGGSGSGVGGSGSGGGESGSGVGGSGSGGSTSPSTTTAVRTVKISMVVHRGQGDFSDVPNQPFRGVCQPDGIRREHEGGEPLWEEESGTVKFGTPLVLTFEVGADRQVWCAFYLQPHARWDRVTDVSTVVNGSSHSATNVECLIPVPGESYRQTVEASQYLPGRSDGCDVAYTIVH